jgi:hypothetical protein
MQAYLLKALKAKRASAHADGFEILRHCSSRTTSYTMLSRDVSPVWVCDANQRVAVHAKTTTAAAAKRRGH